MNKELLLLKQARVSSVPIGWKISQIEKCCKIRNDLRKPISVDERTGIQGDYPYYGPTGILDYINEFRVDGEFSLIGEDGDHFLKPQEKQQTLHVKGKFNVNNHAHIIESTDSCSALWFATYFMNRDITNFLSRQGANRYKLNKATLEKLPILLPTINEQKAISDLLLTWDDAISKAESLLLEKNKWFRHLRYKLITLPRKEGIYDEINLGELCEISKKTKLTTTKGHFPLTVKLHCLGIERNYRASPNITEKGRPYFQHKSGDFLIGRQNFHNGGFGIIPSDLDGGITSNAISCIKIDELKLLKDFLWFQISDPNYYKRVGHVMDGTGQKELSDKQILNLRISLPNIERQNQISEILSSARKEIDLLENLLKKYKFQKRGLMQKLLTGQWRINPDVVNQYKEA
jgi:type I restriction enzyme S subunit